MNKDYSLTLAKQLSITGAYAVHLKVTYESMKTWLEDINYLKHNCNICANLKLVSLIVGLQLGNSL